MSRSRILSKLLNISDKVKLSYLDVTQSYVDTQIASKDEFIELGGTITSGQIDPTVWSSFDTNIVPDTTNLRSLGSLTKTWKDVYIGPGSLYINGQKVIEDSAGTIIVSADVNQNLQLETTGSGDLSLVTGAGGTIELSGTVQITAGKNITSSDGNAISVSNEFNMNSEKISSLATPTAAADASTKGYVDTQVAALVDSAPATLDTLKELATALGNDANHVTTMTTLVGTKLSLAGGTMSGDITFNSTQTFDGRDVSADGTKLDSIAAGANNYSLPTSVVHDTEVGALHSTDALSISGHTITLKKGDGSTETVVVPDNDTVYTHPTNHPISLVTGLQTALDGKVDDAQVLTNVPAGALFTDTIYTHPANHAINVITGLQTALDGKVDDAQVLTNVPTGALFTDTIYTHPANHPISLITGLQSALDGKVDDAQVLTNVPAGALFTDTIYNKPSSEPISYITGLQVALDSKTNEAYVDGRITTLIGAAPAALDTLQELGDALGDDANFAATMTTALAGKVDDAQVLTNVPAGAVFTDTVYSHPGAHAISFITGLQATLDAKVDDAQVLTNVPTGALFTDTIYTHPTNHTISVITGLQAALDSKVDDSQVLTNVPTGALFTDTDTNTTYSAGSGITLTGTTFSTNYGTTSGTSAEGDHSHGAAYDVAGEAVAMAIALG